MHIVTSVTHPRALNDLFDEKESEKRRITVGGWSVRPEFGRVNDFCTPQDIDSLT